jgi:hypothetical protein
MRRLRRVADDDCGCAGCTQSREQREAKRLKKLETEPKEAQARDEVEKD